MPDARAPSALNVTGPSLILIMRYDPTGLAWCELDEAAAVSWVVDAAAPTTTQPVPVIIGPWPTPPPNTAPVVSPAWIAREFAIRFVEPSTATRGDLPTLLTFIATNNGAQRKLWCKFEDWGMATAFQAWATSHPSLALTEAPGAA
jgi:hypothetical protein